jgi:hypothetical protein
MMAAVKEVAAGGGLSSVEARKSTGGRQPSVVLYRFRTGTGVKKAQRGVRAREGRDDRAAGTALAAGTQQLLRAVAQTHRASVSLTAQQHRALAELINALAELLDEPPENA